MSAFLSYSARGGSAGVPIYINIASFPVSSADGSLGVAKDTGNLYEYNATSMAWQLIGGPGAMLSVGTIDSVTPAANGGVDSNNSLILQSASATVPGLVNNSAQTLSGIKTFSSLINADGGVDRSTLGTLSFGTNPATTNVINIGNASSTVNIQGTVITETTTVLNVTNPTIILNAGGLAGSASNSGVTINEGGAITGYITTSGDRNSWIAKAPNTIGVVTLTPGASGITLNQSSHNPVTIGTANGLSLAGQVLSIQLASVSQPGALSAADYSSFTTGAANAANKTLSNLTTTSINANLIPNANNTINLGAGGTNFNFGYINQVVANTLTSSSTSSNISLGVSTIYDTSAIASVNWDNRKLIASDGVTTTIQYGSNTGPITITQAVGDNSLKIATTAFVTTAVSGGAGANRALSNLTATSINANLIPAISNVTTIGAYGINFNFGYINQIVATTLASNSNSSYISLALQTIYDTGQIQSINWDTRRLIASDGLTATIQYGSNTGPITITQAPGDNSLKIATTAFVTTAVSGGAGANKTLSNLIAPTAVGVNLLPDLSANRNLGSAALYWNGLFVSAITNYSDGFSVIDVVNRRLINNLGATLLTFSGSGLVASSALNMSSNLINNVINPVSAQDAATKNYVDTAVATIPVSANKTLSNLIAPTAIGVNLLPDLSANRNLGSAALYWNGLFVSTIANYADGQAVIDVVNRRLINNLGATLLTFSGSGLVASSALNMSSNLINNVVNPVSAQDAATKNYVDTAIAAIPVGANTSLSNLTATSLNIGLVPSAGYAFSLGTAAKPFNQLIVDSISAGTTYTAGIVLDVSFRRLRNTATTIVFDFSGSSLTALVPLNMSSNLINNVVNPVSAQDAATKNYVDTAVATIPVSANKTLSNLIATTAVGVNLLPDLSGSRNLGAAAAYWAQLFVSAITNYSDGFSVIDVVNRRLINNLGATLLTFSGSGLVASSALNMSSNLINNVVNPVSAQDAATKNYVDTAVATIPAGANKTLSNLIAPTAVGVNLLPDLSANRNLGAAAAYWAQLFVSAITNYSDGFSVIDVVNRRLINNLGATLLTFSGSGLVASSALNMSSNLINNVINPVSAQDAATKNYVDTAVATIPVSANKTLSNLIAPTAVGVNLLPDLSGSRNLGSAALYWNGLFVSTITNYVDGQAVIDVVNRRLINNLGATLLTFSGSGLVASSALNMSSNLINNVVNPVSAQDAATKNYVDTAVATIPVGANTSLSNLTATSLNIGLVPSAGYAFSLGTAAKPFNQLIVDSISAGTTYTAGIVLDVSFRRLRNTATTIVFDFSGSSLTALVPLNMSSNLINNVINPVSAQDAATKNYVDTAVATIPVSANKTLSNLIATTAVGVNLLPDLSGSRNLGAAAAYWAQLFVSAITNYSDGFSVVDVVNRRLINNLGATLLTFSGSGLVASSALNMSSNVINAVANPVSAQDAATKNYVDTAVATIPVSANKTLSNLIAPTAIGVNLLPDLSANRNLGAAAAYWAQLFVSAITNYSDGFSVIDVVNRRLINNLGATLLTFSGSGLVASSALNMSSNLINNVVNPVSAQDAATKNYVDTAVATIPAGANKTLSNLIATTAVGVNLLPDLSGSRNLGAAAAYWAQLFVSAITNYSDGFSVIDVVNRRLINNLGATLLTFSGSGLVASSALNMSSNLINNVVNPVSAQDAATKNYVDTAIAAGGSGANTTLSNLVAPVALNQNLQPAVNNVGDLGSATKFFNNVYVNGMYLNGGTITNTGSLVAVIGGSSQISMTTSGFLLLTGPAGNTPFNLTCVNGFKLNMSTGKNFDFNTGGGINIADPVNAQDVVSKKYVDNRPIAPTLQSFTSGSGTYQLPYYFVVTSANATAGDTYTTNFNTFTVVNNITSGTILLMHGSGPPLATGVLTKTSGSGDATITFSSNRKPLYISVKMVGGGGAGAGSGTSGSGSGGNGTNTTFGTSLLAANAGSGGAVTTGGAGGSASLGSGPIGTAIAGTVGNSLPAVETGGSFGIGSGAGGNATFFNGSGGSTYQAAGQAGIANTGGGGAGGGGGSTAGSIPGSGGGAGGFVDAIISPISITYAYAIGTGGSGGTAGTAGYAGGNGGSGYIRVLEYYQ